MFDSPFTRRRLLAAGLATAAIGGLPAIGSARAVTPGPRRLLVERRILDVGGRAAPVFGLRRPDGAHGIALDPGERFAVDLDNRCGEPTIVHWHGQTPPVAQDGVAGPSVPPLADGEVRAYDFDARPGTHWMHAHHGLQELRLLAAPLVVRTGDDVRADVQEVTILLHDFSFTDPAELLARLTGGMGMGHAGHAMPGVAAGGASMDHAGHTMAMGADLNDVEYDAYLANDRTLDDPQVIAVERGGRVRLRLINGAASTAFHIDLGALGGTVVAADGNPVHPVAGHRFGMAMGQRLDILVTIPAGGGAFPVLAQREGDRRRTGVVLATPGAGITRVDDHADAAAGAVDLSLERRLAALDPLMARPANRTITIRLSGAMMPYVWTIDDRPYGRHEPLRVRSGERIVLTMVNDTGMAHPMHLHGHHVQVVAVDGAAIAGAVRDTVLVPVAGSVTVAFDADNPGRWLLHCHNLLHMATGMMTEVVYDGAA